MILIGDIHGEFYDFKNTILKKYRWEDCVQLGDMGLGFDKKFDALYPDPKEYKNLRFIRGNHDNPEVCRNHPHYLGDYGTYKNLFFISGAASIDKMYRVEGVSWWPDEELNYTQQRECMELYLKEKPETIITHDCPLRVCREIYTHEFKNTTGIFYDNLFDEHKPKTWIFAHHHKSFKLNLHGTQFICLNTFETLDMEKI